MEPIPNPHDRFFRHVFSQRDIAADFLHNYLPPAISELLDFSTLMLTKDSFVDDSLREHFSDLLYLVQQRADEQSVFVYVLLEHKSYAEPSTALQLLRHMTQIWNLVVRPKGEYTPILPVVVYHGQIAWHVPRDFASLFKMPAPLEEYFPNFRYWLIDLSSMDDADIKGEVLAQVALLTLKHIFQNDLDASLHAMVPLLVQLARQKTGLQFLETWLRYLSQGTNKVSETTLQDVVEEVSTTGGVAMPTLAEIWTERGYQQGLQQGLRQGRHETAQQEILAGIEVALELRFGVDGLRLLPEIARIEDSNVLRAVLRSIKAAATPDDIRRIYQ